MTSIVSYQKHTDSTRTVELRLPNDPQTRSFIGQELCTINGVTYVSIPSGATLPQQPPEVAATVQTVTLTDELREDIKAKSPVVRLIADQMTRQIRSVYSLDDEMFFARIGVGAASGLYTPSQKEMAEMRDFGAFVEGVRAWGRAERAKLGL
jgi:hypothetical protein